MKTRVVITLLTLILSINLYSQQERTFNVSKGGTLEMRVNYGDIKIQTGNSNEVVIRTSDEFDDNDRIAQSGNTVSVLSETPKDFTVKVPEEFSLSLSTSGGDITISGNATGKLMINTAAGSISFQNVRGDFSANTGGGDITGSNITGKTEINTAGGDIKINQSEGEINLNTAGGDININKMMKPGSINTGGGNIIVGSADGKSSIRTGGGDVKVNSAGSGINITTGGGDMTITDSKGEVVVTSGGGDIKINNKSGSVKIKTGAGNITADFVPGGSGENSLITGSGDVKLVIPENSKTTVRVITKGKRRDDVQIKSDFTLTTENIEDDKVISVYQINGGGSLIDIKNGYGLVEIRKK